MSKIVCDICGTTYPDTAECCPICGCVREPETGYTGEELPNDSRFPGRKKEIFDFDEVNPDPELELYSDEDEEEDDEIPYDEEEEEEDEGDGHSTLLVILLTVLIAGLLLVAGFLYVRFFLPNHKQDAATVTTSAPVLTEAQPEESTEATIPCDTLTIFSGMKAELSAEGQYFLLNVKAMPENTTDKILYTVADENVATVDEDGRITAVGEGETTVFISCGKISQECPVIVKYVEETVPATTEAVVAETEAEAERGEETQETQTATPEETVAETTATNTAVNPNVVLKLKKTDIMLGVYYQFTLELDCDLEQNQVEWSSEHPHIATVDENGVVTAVKSGTTSITAKYGDQEVHCMVRCG